MDQVLINSHGTIMIVAWILFGSTGILFARYGRILRFGNHRQCLGKSVWFQIHRFFLSLSFLLTLVGFFLIVLSMSGGWVTPITDGIETFVHSILGSLVVWCVILQIWLALYRCHPNSRFRFWFNWSHRLIGFFAFGFSLINLLIIICAPPIGSIAAIIIVSIWTGWFLIVLIIFEIIQYQYRKASALMALNARINNSSQVAANINPIQDTESSSNPTVDNQRLNKVKLILLFLHVIISVVLCIPLIVIIWNES